MGRRLYTKDDSVHRPVPVHNTHLAFDYTSGTLYYLQEMLSLPNGFEDYRNKTEKVLFLIFVK